MSTAKRILVAPLDWGLGHVTRSIPIVKALLKRGHKPILATDGRPYDLLKAEFPDQTVLRLKGYHPVYPKKGNMGIVMGLQAPRFLSAIANERKQVTQWVDEYSIDGVISDNRFGAYSLAKPRVFITHQVNIKVPDAVAMFARPLNKLNHHYISKFDRCWIPDLPYDESISGQLSTPPAGNEKFRYIGALSRLSTLPTLPKQYDLLVLLSGPEPQRTLLENKVRMQLELLDMKVFLVQGITEMKELQTVNHKLDVCSYLTAEELTIALASSEMVVCRSGYSTVMDLVAVGKKALFIPTPGQTEQEYLSVELHKKGYFHSVTQDRLDLAHDLELSKGFVPPKLDAEKLTLFETELDDWLDML